MKKIVIAAFILLCTHGLFASDKEDVQQISGIITDVFNDSPMPFANVICGKYGTSSDEDGRFMIQFPMDVNLDSMTLHVRYVGFESQTTHLKRFKDLNNIQISMVPEIEVLLGVSVYTAEEIIKDIHTYHQINYEYQDLMMRANYSEVIKNTEEELAVASGTFDILLPTIYRKDEPQAELINSYRDFSDSLNWEKIPVFHGHVLDMVESLTRRKDSFLAPKQNKNYYFHKVDIIDVNEHKCFVIEFEPANRRGNTSGLLYIDIYSKALIKAEYYPDITSQKFWTNVKWEEDYTMFNGTWCVKQVTYSGDWEEDGLMHNYTAQFEVDRFDVASEGHELDGRLLSKYDIFLFEAGEFDEENAVVSDLGGN